MRTALDLFPASSIALTEYRYWTPGWIFVSTNEVPLPLKTLVCRFLPRTERRTTIRSELLVELQLRASESGALRSRTPCSTGGVASYESWTGATAVLPAWSVQ